MVKARAASHIVLFAWVALGFILLLPLLTGLASSELADQSRGVDPARLWRLGRNSLHAASLATVAALVLALPVALGATRLAGRREALTLLLIACVPLFIPPTVMALAGVRLFGPTGYFTDFITGGQPTFPVIEALGGGAPTLPGSPIYNFNGCGLVMAWSFYPILLLAAAAALRHAGDESEEAALLETGPAGVLARITLPRALGGIAAGAAFVFMFALTDLGIPEALRSLPVLVAEVYVQFGIFYDTRRALATSMLLVVAAFAVLALGLVAARVGGVGRAVEEGLLPANDNRALFRFHPLQRWSLRGLAWFFAFVPPLLAIGVLALTVNSPQGRLAVWKTTWDTAAGEVGFTLWLGFLLALCVGAVGSLLGVALFRLKRPGVWRFLILVPLILPAPVMAIGISVLVRLPPGTLPLGIDDALASLARTQVPLLLAWTFRFAPIAALLIEALLRRIPSELFEVARIEGAGRFAIIRSVLWPYAWHALAAGMLIGFALCLGDVGAAVLLIPPGPTTLGVRLFTLMHFAPEGQVSALSLLVLMPGVIAYLIGMVMLAVFARGPRVNR